MHGPDGDGRLFAEGCCIGLETVVHEVDLLVERWPEYSFQSGTRKASFAMTISARLSRDREVPARSTGLDGVTAIEEKRAPPVRRLEGTVGLFPDS